jgi:hypothetical protein
MPINGRSSLNPNRRCLLQSKKSGVRKEFVKINTDATFYGASRVGGWDAICHDAVGDLCFVVAGSLQMVSDHLHLHAGILSFLKSGQVLGEPFFKLTAWFSSKLRITWRATKHF